MSDTDRNEAILTLVNRYDLLDLLCQSPHHMRDIIDETGQSRSTVHRAVNELTELGLVRRGDNGIEATITGRFARDQFGEYLDVLGDILTADAILEPVPTDSEISYDIVTGAEKLLTTDPGPYRLADRIHDDLVEATAIRLLLPTIEESRTVRVLYEHVITHGNTAELVVSRDVFRMLQDEFPRRIAVLAASEQFTIHVGEVPTYALGLLDRGPKGDTSSLAHLVVHNDNAGVHGLIVNGTDRGISWATEQYERYRRDATDKTTELIPDSTGATDESKEQPIIGQSLPVTLEREGFRRVDGAYFRNEQVAKPTTAWRSGLSLAEVHTGYAVTRPMRTDSGESSGSTSNFATAVTADLTNGKNVTVLGRPGSGKSTVCKQVVCEWYDADRGPILYRKSERGRSFSATGELEEVVTESTGRILIVVEDAVRPDANAIFEVLEGIDSDANVSVLLDSREHEWNAYLKGASDIEEMEIRHLPSMRFVDCERLVDHFEWTLGKTVDVSPEQLWETVHEETVGGPSDEMLRLVHRIATYADPLANEPTPLEQSAVSLYERIADDELTLSVGTLVHTLNAAGLGVDKALLYAVAEKDNFEAVGSALDRLDGEVLFSQEGGRYRTVHEELSKTFLAHLAELSDSRELQRFGAVVTAVLALADEPARREHIQRHVTNGEVIEVIAEDTNGWADDIAEAIYTMAEKRADLSPLFGDGQSDSIDLPSACSDEVINQQPIWLGEAFLGGSYYDCAERAFERLALDESATAIERLLGLARVEIGRGNYETAVDYCEESLSVLEATGESLEQSSVLRARTRLRFGEALTRHNQYEGANTQCQTALQTLPDGYPGWRAEILRTLADVACKCGEYETAKENYQASLELSRSVGDRRAEANTINNLGRVPWSHGDYGEARTYFERALELRREIGDTRGEAGSLYNLGIIARKRSEYDRARELLEQSLDGIRAVGNQHIEHKVLAALGLNHMRQGDYERAQQIFEEWLEYSEDVGDRHDKARALNNLALVTRRQGKYERANRFFEESLELKEEFGDRRGVARTRSNLGEVAVIQGRFDRATELLEGSLELKEKFDGEAEMASTLNSLGTSAFYRDGPEQAQEYFERALDIATRVDESNQIAIAHNGLAEIALENEQYETVDNHIESAFAAIAGEETTLETEILLTRGKLALAGDDLRDARRHTESAQESFESRGDRLWIGRGTRLLGQIERSEDNPDSARELLLDSLTIFEEIGAYYDLMEALSMLAEAYPDGADVVETHRDRVREALAEAPEGVAERHTPLLSDTQ